ncbi:MAG: hypothetical protein ACREBU_11560 [Nitrososphaera sp.]
MSHSDSGKRKLGFDEIIDILEGKTGNANAVSDIYATVMSYIIDATRRSKSAVDRASLDSESDENITMPSRTTG